jgi:hypothetical protein
MSASSGPVIFPGLTPVPKRAVFIFQGIREKGIKPSSIKIATQKTVIRELSQMIP